MKAEQIKDESIEQVFTECTVISREIKWIEANPILLKYVENLPKIKLDYLPVTFVMDVENQWVIE